MTARHVQPIMPLSDLTGILRCPRCRAPLAPSGLSYRCTNSDCVYGQDDTPFPLAAGQPVLIDFDSSLFARDEFSRAAVEQPPGGVAAGSGASRCLRRWRKRLLRGGNRAAADGARNLVAEITKSSTRSRPRILVVGGGTVGDGSQSLYDNPAIDIVGTDVYPSPLTRLVADAHHLPFADASFDGVWVQAVLEHVLEPELVVDEIHRVLRRGGIVFADTPFMQQVHMGAYDFTRYTFSGHRWLFRRFEQIDAGLSGGPGVAMQWSARSLARALGAPPAVAGVLAAPFFWLRFLDRFTLGRRGLDAAAGVYFLGRRSETALSPKDMIDYYRTAGRSGQTRS